ncbi:MAG: polysaccharide biosynthesis tyrosine autokinase [Pseudomonadota bacterium]|nr:polysaccharide biosynthesis tyrosine autokinase [Pseudomonadota bacterium]
MKAEDARGPEREEDLIDFPELARTFGRYKWGIIGLTLLVSAIAALVAFSLRPMYRGSVTLLIESQNQRVARIGDVYDTTSPETEFLGNQIAVLLSREIARRAVERLDLANNAEFLEEPSPGRFKLLDLREYLPFVPEDMFKSEPPSEEDKLNALIDTFMSRVTVLPYGRTQVVLVQYDAYSAELAAKVANTLADLYIESGLQARLDATTKATSWLTEKLAEIQAQLSDAEKSLQFFREKEKLVNVGGTRGLTEDELLDYSRRLREAQRERSNLQNAYEKIRMAGDDPRRMRDISALLNDSVVQQANSSFLQAQETLRQAEERYGAKHPLRVAAQARLDNAESSLNEQLRIAARGIQSKYEISRDSEADLSQRLNSAKSNVQRLDRKDYELSVLEREVTTYRELYDTFLTRFKETDVASSYQDVTARVIDPAVEPRRPESPNKKKIVLISALGALAASIMLAVLHYMLSESISSAEQLEAVTHLPVFGVLPLVRGFGGRKQNLPTYFADKSRTPFAEGVRSICASLRLSSAVGAPKRVMLTSSIPGEGKSSLSGAIALAMAASERVLLIETDLRKPALRRYFGLNTNSKGVADFVSGSPLEECVHFNEIGKVWVMPAGRVSANPSDILNLPAFHQMLDQASARFDRIIFDSPPCQAAADALVIGRLCDGVIFVVKSDATSRRAVKNSLKQLRNAGVNLLGTVVNQVDTRRNPHYADTYYYAYGYYG